MAKCIDFNGFHRGAGGRAAGELGGRHRLDAAQGVRRLGHRVPNCHGAPGAGRSGDDGERGDFAAPHAHRGDFQIGRGGLSEASDLCAHDNAISCSTADLTFQRWVEHETGLCVFRSGRKQRDFGGGGAERAIPPQSPRNLALPRGRR
eukprot:3848786-Rhodomonas_salina.1